MRRMRISLLALVAVIAASALQAQVLAPAFAVGGRLLGSVEASKVIGGETYMDVDFRYGRAEVASIPRDSYGMDYSRASSYSVEVHNNLTDRLQDGGNDYYEAAPFPKGETTMRVGKIPDQYRQERYGSSSGEWVKTDATREVTAYPKKADGTADKSQPTTRSDGGYFLHANNAAAFSSSKSAGCILTHQSSLDRIIATIKCDNGPKKLNVH